MLKLEEVCQSEQDASHFALVGRKECREERLDKRRSLGSDYVIYLFFD